MSPHAAPDLSASNAAPLPRISPDQWKSGIAAWLGWLFDGLDMQLYTLVAAKFVAELLGNADPKSAAVTTRASIIQAAFLVGFAFGGAFFGRIADRIGRSRALSLTILTYALFTGLSAVATSWWQLLIFRFLSALGIGGEWGVGSSLLSETWPARWRVWVAAVLQTGVNVGVMLAAVTSYAMAGLPSARWVFLVGILPAFVVLWIRRAVPEPEEWKTARAKSLASPGGDAAPGLRALFAPGIRAITLRCTTVCACALTAWWAFLFWSVQHLKNLPELSSWTEADRNRLVSIVFFLQIGVSILGNFFAAAIARRIGYRNAIAVMFVGFFATMFTAYSVERTHVELAAWCCAVGFFSGVFALFTMYLPPLFPTLLRTTGAGFCFNIGRIAAAAGTVIFGLFTTVGDFRIALLSASFLFIPALIVTFFMPDRRDNAPPPVLAAIVEAA